MGCASHRRGPWWCGVLGQAVDARAPRRAVLRHLAPRLEVRRDARALERPVQRVAERVLGPPVRARVADPRGEELARDQFGAHARDVPCPPHLALRCGRCKRKRDREVTQLLRVPAAILVAGARSNERGFHPDCYVFMHRDQGPAPG
jgi:hypothetical protein